MNICPRRNPADHRVLVHLYTYILVAEYAYRLPTLVLVKTLTVVRR